MNPDGATVATATAPCSMSHPSAGWAEQEPGEWKRALIAAVREVREQAGVARDEIEALALACQVDGLVALDADLRPLRPAIIWLDRRADRQTDALAAAAGAEALIARTGLQPGRLAHRAEGDVAARRGARALPRRALARARRRPPDRLAHRRGRAGPRERLLDARSTTCTPARWNDELVGARRARRRTSCRRSAPAHEIAGALRPEAAEALGLSTACEVVVGTGDEHAAALGAGALGPRRSSSTSPGPPSRSRSRPTTAVIDDEGLVETHAHAVDGDAARREPRLRLGRQHALARRDRSGISAGGGLRARRRRRRPAPTACCSCPRCRARWRRAGTTACAARSPGWR